MSSQPESIETAIAAARAADEKQADDVVVLDVSEILAICDVFLICSARNQRLVAAVADEIEEQLWLGQDRRPIATEGRDDRHWVLLDYGDIVVHVFHEEDRAYYRLDRLYGDAPRLEWRLAVEVEAVAD